MLPISRVRSPHLAFPVPGMPGEFLLGPAESLLRLLPLHDVVACLPEPLVAVFPVPMFRPIHSLGPGPNCWVRAIFSASPGESFRRDRLSHSFLLDAKMMPLGAARG